MILVVDDEPAVRDLVASILAQAGYQVQTAGNGGEALQLMELRTPELLLTDIVMPEMSGLALAARAHRDHPGLRVMFMSGFANQYEEELSGSVCLGKPFTPSRLLAAVEEVLSLGRSG